MDFRQHRRYEVNVPVDFSGDEISGKGTATNLSLGGRADTPPRTLTKSSARGLEKRRPVWIPSSTIYGDNSVDNPPSARYLRLGKRAERNLPIV